MLLVGADLAQFPGSLGGSEYLAVVHGMEAGPIDVDLKTEAALIEFLVDAADDGLLCSAHDVSVGGLAVAIAECAIANGIGIKGALGELGSRIDAALFGEAGNRAVISVEKGKLAAVDTLAASKGLPLIELGLSGGDRIRLGSSLDLPIDQMETVYREALPSIMD